MFFRGTDSLVAGNEKVRSIRVKPMLARRCVESIGINQSAADLMVRDEWSANRKLSGFYGGINPVKSA